MVTDVRLDGALGPHDTPAVVGHPIEGLFPAPAPRHGGSTA
jgi:hypothetical protein